MIPGYGRSEGDRAYVRRFNDYVVDVLQFAEMVSAEFPESARFLLGHSMGGTIAILTAMASPDKFWDGIVLSGPGNWSLVHDCAIYLSSQIVSSSAIVPDSSVATPFRVFVAKTLSEYLPKVNIT